MPSWHFAAIGTHWSIDTQEPLQASIESEIADRIEAFDKTYSRFRDDSVVTSLATTPQTITLPDDAVNLFALYRSLYEATSGSLSPLVGDALTHLGYDRTYRLTSLPGPPPPIPSFDEVISLEGNTLTSYRPVTIDIGAAGKGFLVDLVAGILTHHKVDSFTVDGSGDLIHRGSTPERVGLEHPHNPDLAIGVAEINNCALAASAPQRRAWDHGLHHIIDALTGLPTATVEATFVVADSAAVADGLATALFFTSPETLLDSFSFDWVVVKSGETIQVSPNFPGEVFSRG